MVQYPIFCKKIASKFYANEITKSLQLLNPCMLNEQNRNHSLLRK